MENFQQQAPGRYRLSGELGFSTVDALLKTSVKQFSSQSETSISVDLGQVKHTDSAGLALLIEWLKLAARFNKTLSYCNLPKQLISMAQAMGLDELLESHSQTGSHSLPKS